MHMALYLIALHILLCNLQNFVYSFIDMDNNNNNKKQKKKTEKKNCKFKIDVRLSLKMGGMLYMVRKRLEAG